MLVICMKCYIKARLVTWESYYQEVERAIRHLKDNGILAWRTGVCLRDPIFAVKTKGDNTIVALMFSEGCLTKEELMARTEKVNDQLVFKDGEYKGLKIRPQEWHNVDFEMADERTCYLMITGIIADLNIDESRVYCKDSETGQFRSNKNWRPGAHIFIL